MGTITRLNGSNLYWLGRYTERVFTTLNSFFNYFDLMIDVDKESYKNYLEKIGAPNIYTDDSDFFDRYLFDKTDPNSLRSNLERAMDNGIVLREAIKSSSLSYLQLALNKFKSVRGTRKVRYDLLPVRDDLYAFWESAEDNMGDLEGRDLIYIGKAVERLDLFVRLSYKDEDIRRVFNYLTGLVHPYENVYNHVLNVEAYESLEKLLTRGKGIESCRLEALSLISRLVEVKTDEEADI
ncbi:MAG: alpha-E domain-containing protein [Oscillospiraceae bacterium]|nr:alpha-E domain-containing protein [Oscillospiraceae bacterium]